MRAEHVWETVNEQHVCERDGMYSVCMELTVSEC